MCSTLPRLDSRVSTSGRLDSTRLSGTTSRSLSHSRTKSIAKASSTGTGASASAAASGDESDAKSGRGWKRKLSAAASLAAQPVPPITTTVGER